MGGYCELSTDIHVYIYKAIVLYNTVKDHLDVIRKLVQEMAQICREKDDDTPTALIPHMKHFEKVYILNVNIGRTTLTSLG